MLPFEEWDVDLQSNIAENLFYDFRNKTALLWWEEEDKASPWGYKECARKDIPAAYFLTVKGNYSYYQPIVRETKIFKNILKGVCNIGNSEFLTYYFFGSISPFNLVIPDEDVGIINTTIQLYEENYNDRVTNLKAAFEQRKLEYLQSSGVPTKVSRLRKGV